MHSIGAWGAVTPASCCMPRGPFEKSRARELDICRLLVRGRKTKALSPLRCNAFHSIPHLAEIALPPPSDTMQVPLWAAISTALLGATLVNFTMAATDSRNKAQSLNEIMKQEIMEQKIALAESKARTKAEALELHMANTQRSVEGKVEALELRLNNSQGLVQAKMEILGKAIDGVEESLEKAIEGVKSMKVRLDRLEKEVESLRGRVDGEVVSRLEKVEGREGKQHTGDPEFLGKQS